MLNPFEPTGNPQDDVVSFSRSGHELPLQGLNSAPPRACLTYVASLESYETESICIFPAAYRNCNLKESVDPAIPGAPGGRLALWRRTGHQ